MGVLHRVDDAGVLCKDGAQWRARSSMYATSCSSSPKQIVRRILCSFATFHTSNEGSVSAAMPSSGEALMATMRRSNVVICWRMSPSRHEVQTSRRSASLRHHFCHGRTWSCKRPCCTASSVILSTTTAGSRMRPICPSSAAWNASASQPRSGPRGRRGHGVDGTLEARHPQLDRVAAHRETKIDLLRVAGAQLVADAYPRFGGSPGVAAFSARVGASLEPCSR